LTDTLQDVERFILKGAVDEQAVRGTVSCWTTTVEDGGRGFCRVSWTGIDAWYCYYPEPLLSTAKADPRNRRPILVVAVFLIAAVVGPGYLRYRD